MLCLGVKFLQRSPITIANSPEELVSYISQVMTLLPGDVILTGTPKGVAPLQIGETVTIEIESIGKLTNGVNEL